MDQRGGRLTFIPFEKHRKINPESPKRDSLSIGLSDI